MKFSKTYLVTAIAVVGAGAIAAGCVPPAPEPVPAPNAANTFFSVTQLGNKALLDGALMTGAPQAQLALTSKLNGTTVCATVDGTDASISGGVCGGTSVELSVLEAAGAMAATCFQNEMDVVQTRDGNPKAQSISVAFEWDDTVNEALVNQVNSISYSLDCTTYIYGAMTAVQTISNGAVGSGTGTGTGYALIHPLTNNSFGGQITNATTVDLSGIGLGIQDMLSTVDFGFGGPVGTAQLCASDAEMCDSAAGSIQGVQTVVECDSDLALLCANVALGVADAVASSGTPVIIDAPIAYDLAPASQGGTGISFNLTKGGASTDYSVLIADYPFTIPAAP